MLRHTAIETICCFLKGTLLNCYDYWLIYEILYEKKGGKILKINSFFQKDKRLMLLRIQHIMTIIIKEWNEDKIYCIYISKKGYFKRKRILFFFLLLFFFLFLSWRGPGNTQ